MNLKNFKFDVDQDGIALATWDMPGRSMNVFTSEVLQELSEIVEKAAGDSAINGVVITSGKDAFSGGADLTMLEGIIGVIKNIDKAKDKKAAMQQLFDESRKMSVIYRRLETSGKPWVAAVNGTAVGGAFELMLACHHRVVSENEKTRLGLPEVKIGLFPGAGGTQRLPRMIPAADALQLMLRGDQIRVDRAKAMKLVDEVVPQDKLVETAKAWIKNGGKAQQPWDQEGFKLPGGPVYSKAGMMVWPPANAIYRRETYDNYPGARGIMKSTYEGLLLPIDQGLRVESRYFANVLRTKEAAAMIRSLFVSMQELNKGARRPANVAPSKIRKVAVLGAGFMGASIAYVTASAGIEVVLVDKDQESADKGKSLSDKLISDQIKKGGAKPLGIEDALEDGICLVEWPELIYGMINENYHEIEITIDDKSKNDESRIVKIKKVS
jgi:3-hydroxyacyl-CoA dehydrogenase/enoyl-CoA hydratase/3-hydroxybutyryl-CoA epimerase